MTDTDPEIRDRLARLLESHDVDVETRLQAIRGAPPRPPGPSAQRIVAAAVAFIVAAAAIGLAAYAFLRSPEAPQPAAPQGGSIVVASDWPECLNPITNCAAATGAWWTVLAHVLPHAMVLDEHGNWIASPLLIEAPSLANGGLTESPFTVTYHLKPNATWADGTPITSADFEFTWRAVMNTEGAYDTAGYDLIESIDTTDPKAVVIWFKDVYVDWPSLFGGPQGGLLEKAAFPTFANDPRPNLKDEMQRSVPFSGGPWMLKSWRSVIVLTRNDRYYGERPRLDQVTFVPRQTDGLQPVIAGSVALIQLFPDDPRLFSRLDLSSYPNVRDVQAVGGDGFLFEALWFNPQRPPLDDPRVREALMHAINRQAIIDAFVKAAHPNAEVLNCGFIAFPRIGPWCETRPFERFTYDPERARSILESAGYDCGHTPCTKNGEKLIVEFSTVSTNLRRTMTQDLLKDPALRAGIELRIKNFDARGLFDETGPYGRFMIVEFAASGSLPDPSVTLELACESIPSEDNGFAGLNWIRWCNREATDLMHRADRELDPQKRLELMNQIYELQAQDFIGLPLYVIPQITVWRSDKVAGPVSRFSSSPNGPFWNMNEWFVPKAQARG